MIAERADVGDAVSVGADVGASVSSGEGVEVAWVVAEVFASVVAFIPASTVS